MTILLAGGGTAGHINPAISIANYIKERHPKAKICFAGTPKGMEANLVPKAGYEFYPVDVKGFQRKLSLKNIGRNIEAAVKVFTSSVQAGGILKKTAPDLVIGTGGYVSGPVLRKAAKMGIKTAIHEQNAFPGVTTKMLAPHMDAVMLAMEDAKKHLPSNREYVVTGNPVREEVIRADKQKSRRALGLDERPVILSFGGSLGARTINEMAADIIAWHWKDAKYQHLHATGRYGVELMPRLLREKGVELEKAPQVRITEYIDNMDECMAAADLVICRSGAIALSELEAQGKASILIPSPNVAENHQYHNAMSLARRGAAVVIEEKELTAERMIAELNRLLVHPGTLWEMGQNAKNEAVLDANERIYQVLMGLL